MEDEDPAPALCAYQHSLSYHHTRQVQSYGCISHIVRIKGERPCTEDIGIYWDMVPI